jgi:hypothetical protein
VGHGQASHPGSDDDCSHFPGPCLVISVPWNMSDFGVDAVIFDLGGVLADFGGVGPMRALAGIDTDEEL